MCGYCTTILLSFTKYECRLPYEYCHCVSWLVLSVNSSSIYNSNLLIILAEQPYDSIPNFSAADALRITDVGRNEFIDIMNKCRSKVLLSTIPWPFCNITGSYILAGI